MCLNVSVVKLCLYVSECVCSKIMSECVCSKIIKELPGLVGSGTPCIRLSVLEGRCGALTGSIWFGIGTGGEHL